MLQPRLQRSIRTVDSLTTSFCSCFASLRISTAPPKAIGTPITFTRQASHAAQGRANGPKDSAGRRLGAKKTASEYVIPGNIIFRQRGTKWHPGENVGIGRDHTIYATETGYVRFYRDPERHPKRRYIGVALERDGPMSMLPTPKNAARRRRLNMFAAPRTKSVGEGDLAFNTDGSDELPKLAISEAASASRTKNPRSRYMHRESNWEIGRAAEKKGITVREFDRNDRWLAWRKRAAKAQRSAVLRAAKSSRKGNPKKAQRAQR